MRSVWSDLRVRARALLRRDAVEAELDCELRSHFEHLVEKLEEAGLSRLEAERRARWEFGGLEQIKAECRDARGISLVETTAQDLRYAFRLLRKDATATLIVVMTLALGIGATTAAFSLVEAILFKPLPYPEGERLVFPWRLPPPTTDVGFDVIPWGRAELLTFARESRTFEHIGAFLGASFNLTTGDEPVRLDGALVSAGFFPALGVAPQLGTPFGEEDDRPGRTPSVVLSDRLWRERFGGDPSIVGRSIPLNGTPHIVVAVMPPDFTFPRSVGLPDVFTLPRESLLWVPLALPAGPAVRGEPSELAVIGRLARSASLEEAQAELDVFAQRMDREIPRAAGWFRSRAVPMAEQLAGGTRHALLLLWGAVGLLLLIACGNVVHLLLARSIGRTRELTLRVALGGGRARLVRQLVTEHMLLALVGGAAGLGLAAIGVELVKAFGPEDVPRLAEARMDPTVLLFSVVVSVVSGLAVGLLPAWTAVRQYLVSSLNDGGTRSVSRTGSSRARGFLLVSEVALALVLVIASGLLVRTFRNLAVVDAGFDRSRALTFELTLPASSYPDVDRIVTLYRTLLERLRSLPGVESAGIGETVPMDGAGESTGLRIAGRDPTDPEPPFANYTIISPGYLPSVGARLLRGRDFLSSDSETAPPIAIVSAAMARKYWPGQDPIGREVGLPIHPFDMTVIGVVADVKHVSLREEPGPEIYVPFTQKPWPSMLTMHVVLRTVQDPASMTDAVRNAIRAVDPALPLADVTTLDAIVAGAMAPPRFAMVLVSLFGAAALLIACVGLYGAVSYSVESRAQELGIRLALGASNHRVLSLVMGECVRLTGLGIVLGAGVALLASHAMARFLYGVTPTDAVTFLTLSLALLGVALVACYAPARRAMRVDPLTAMRAE